MEAVKVEVENAVNVTNMIDVKMVTPELLKKAARKLKSGKSDPTYSFSSDCFKNSPEIIYVCLSELIQGFLVHGHVTMGLLVSTLIPLVKDPLSSIRVGRLLPVKCVILQQIR